MIIHKKPFSFSIAMLPAIAYELRMLWIPPGTFLIGSPPDEPGRVDEEEQQCLMTISQGFWLSQYLITQAQWQAVMECNPSQFQGTTVNNPVENINWYEATAFCQRLNTLFAEILPQGYQFNLPTEVQWEYACRAGTTTIYHSGNTLLDLARVAWHEENSEGHPHPVGEKEPNAWGLYDMHGNVMEWCYDSFALYPTLPTTDWIGASDEVTKNIRGGSWSTTPTDVILRCAGRGYISPDPKRAWFGMRLCLSR